MSKLPVLMPFYSSMEILIGHKAVLATTIRQQNTNVSLTSRAESNGTFRALNNILQYQCRI